MHPRRLGLFGGTFDPPHRGHVAALRAASRTGRFERLLVTVAGDPYLKCDDVRPASLRLAMAHAAFDDLELVEVSDIEIRRDGPSYTIDTVRQLQDPNYEIDLIIGADLVTQLGAWRESQVLRELVSVGIVPRPNSVTATLEGWRSYTIPMEPVDLSSTFIRDIAPRSENLAQFVPERVIPLFEQAWR